MIKVVGLDIYGTVLSSTDCDNCLPPRKGIEKFFDNCDARNIFVASCSDSYIPNVKIDLKDSGVDILRFDLFFRLDQLPVKDFDWVLAHYNIRPGELLVIGDNPVKDIEGAIRVDAKYLQVAEYRERQDDFDFGKIDFDIYRR